jgi:polysaccharide biosynthesis/export protein
MGGSVLKQVKFVLILLFSIGLPAVGFSPCSAAQDKPAEKKEPYAAATPSGEKTTASKDGSKATRSDAESTLDAVISPKVPGGYRVGADDELLISVWHEPEFSQTVVVRPDGMITMPLLNDIKVVGLTTEELQAVLTEKLKALVNEPQVTVVVKSIKSLKVFLVGSVGKQGMFPLTSGLTVLELLAEGGGLGPFAKAGSIYILRNEGGKQIRIGFKYKDALKGKGNNPLLQPGDMVVVP